MWQEEQGIRLAYDSREDQLAQERSPSYPSLDLPEPAPLCPLKRHLTATRRIPDVERMCYA